MKFIKFVFFAFLFLSISVRITTFLIGMLLDSGILSNTLAVILCSAFIFFISFISLFVGYKRYSARAIKKDLDNQESEEQTAHSPQADNQEENRVTVGIEESEFYTLWQPPEPIDVDIICDNGYYMCKVAKVAINDAGEDVLLYLGDQGRLEEMNIDHYDNHEYVKFIYNNISYDSFDKIVEDIIGKDGLIKLYKKRDSILAYLEQLDIENFESMSVLNQFEPKYLKLSLFVDCFDTSLPDNNRAYEFLCTGLYGFSDDGVITALIGKDIQTYQTVSVRLNTINSNICFDGNEYNKEDFIALAKTFS